MLMRSLCSSRVLRPRADPAPTRGRALTALRAPKVVGNADKTAPNATTAEMDDSVYTDAFLRCFLLGVGSGVLCESGHVLYQLAGLQGVHESVSQMLVSYADRFSPLLVWDHVAALGAWLLVYVAEVVAIMGVMQRYPQDSSKAAQAISSMRTYSRILVPLKLASMKKVLYALTIPRSAAAAASAAAPAAALLAPTVLQFRDSPGSTLTREREVEEIEAAARAPLPPAPTPPTVPLGPQGRAAREAERRTRVARTRQQKRLAPGAWDPASASAVGERRSVELDQRQAFLKNFWYAAALSDKVVAGKPLGVDILGTRVTLFRDEATGEMRCIDDTCPHRGAPLSGGWLHEDSASGHTCVVCPYHGWAFDGEGRLRDVPSAEPGKWPKRPLVNAYPVEERGGFVWLFYGDRALPAEERPPIPFTPELEDPEWKAVYGEIEFETGHWAVFENAIDMAHIHYLHGDSFGNSERPRVMDMTFEEDTFHVEGSFRIHNKPVSALWEWTAVESVPVTAKAMLPSTSAISITLGGGVRMITFVNTVPIDAHRSVNRFCLVRNFAGWEGFDGWARSAMFRILGEDKVMVEQLHPERLEREVSLAPDAPQIAFRRLRQKWIDMGYGVAPACANGRTTSLYPDL